MRATAGGGAPCVTPTAVEDAETRRAIAVRDDEMVVAGIRVFVGGVHSSGFMTCP
jgi:hypothetical protein